MLPLSTTSTAAINHPLLDENPSLWAGVIPYLRYRTYENDSRIVSHGDAAGSLKLIGKGIPAAEEKEQ